MGDTYELSVRRALESDIPGIREIIHGGDWESKYGEVNLCEMLETSFLSVVAVGSDDAVVAFACLNDSPTRDPTPLQALIPSEKWEEWLANRYGKDRIPDLQPINTLWLTMFVADQSMAETALHDTLTTVATTVPSMSYLLFASRPAVGLFSPLVSLFKRLPAADDGMLSEMSVYYCLRTDIQPDLVIRKGLVEDFDDLMPLLQSGVGVLTPPPEEFYLDETLENQDKQHSVLVAEDPDTKAIVGLMCMNSGIEAQTYITKHYNTEVYNKLRPLHDSNTSQRCNSFQITFFYLNPEYESRAASFIQPAFAEFPTCEYCYVALPHTTVEHPLLTDFSYIPLKQGLTLPNGVWLLCRHSLGPLVVMRALQDDVADIESVLELQSELSHETVKKMVSLIKESVRSPDDEEAAAKEMLTTVGIPLTFALFQDGIPVAVCVVQRLSAKEVHHLRYRFEFDHIVSFVPHGQPDYSATNIDPNAPDKRHELSGTVPALLVSHFFIRQAFKNRIRTFLREVLRQTRAQLVFNCLSPFDTAPSSLLAELILALPRKGADSNSGVVFSPTSDATGTALFEEDEDLLCLHFVSKKQLSDEKTKIHARLVVVGASTTGLAAIYAWLTIAYLHVANIVLISRDGIPNHPSSEQDECWFSDSLTWTEREYMLFKIGQKVRIIEGTVIDFERTDKYIVTDNGFIEPYDHLIITAGRQYTIPKELSGNLAKTGIFELSNMSQVNKIKQHIRESEAYEDELSNAVIYGSSKEVYCVATSLTVIGLSPNRLVLVIPDDTSTEAASVFEDSLIDTKVDKLMESLGAKTYKNHVLDRLDYDEDHNLCSVYIQQQAEANEQRSNAPAPDTNAAAASQKKKVAEIPATMFIYCHEKDIDSQILSALNKRSIVFDGRVIVRHNYRTTDPNIYAVGPIAMFSGRFGPSDEFESFNPLEVGTRFAETVLGFLGVEEFYDDAEDESTDAAKGPPDPSNPEAPAEPALAQIPKALPQYADKVSCRVHLPNGFHFFRCKTVRYAEASSQCTHLVSFNARGDNYIRLSIGPKKYIESVAYFGSEEIDVHNLQTLVGFPQSLFNVIYAYEQSKDEGGQPTLDLLEYLKSKWAYAVYYSTYPRFFNEVKVKLLHDEATNKLRENVADYIDKTGANEVDDATRKQFLKSLSDVDSSTRHLVELEMIKFLHSSKQHFPTLYYLPNVTDYVPPMY